MKVGEACSYFFSDSIGFIGSSDKMPERSCVQKTIAVFAFFVLSLATAGIFLAVQIYRHFFANKTVTAPSGASLPGGSMVLLNGQNRTTPPALPTRPAGVTPPIPPAPREPSTPYSTIVYADFQQCLRKHGGAVGFTVWEQPLKALEGFYNQSFGAETASFKIMVPSEDFFTKTCLDPTEQQWLIDVLVYCGSYSIRLVGNWAHHFALGQFKSYACFCMKQTNKDQIMSLVKQKFIDIHLGQNNGRITPLHGIQQNIEQVMSVVAPNQLQERSEKEAFDAFLQAFNVSELVKEANRQKTGF